MWQELVDAAPQIGYGIVITLMYTALGAVSAFVISFVFGLMALSPYIVVRGISRAIVEFFRGTSLVIQLLWFAFVLPQLELGFKLEPLGAATLALALNFGAYGSEIVRGAINAVPKAQWEATVALSLNPIKRMRRVILPQAFPEMVPPFANLLVQMLKGSSLLFLIGITELTFEINELRSDIGSLAAFSIGLVVYFVLAQLLVALMRMVERRAAARVGRGPRFAKISARNTAVTTEAGAGTGAGAY
jgi:polar amino acid transport system permease protein